MPAPRVAELACLGLLDGVPSAESPYIYCAVPGGDRDGAVKALAVLIEPCEAWRGLAARAPQLAASARRAVACMAAPDVPARLHALFAQLNADEYARTHAAGYAAGRGYGLVFVAQAGAELFVAQAPPGQFVIRQGASLHAFPPLVGHPELTLLDDGAEPLGYHPRINPRLLRTRVAGGDVVMVASSAVMRCAPRAARELLEESPDQLLTAIGAACDRSRLRDGAVGIMRFV